MSVESEIRDAMAASLHSLFPGLTLVKTEYFLAAGPGTRGFVDILARTERNSYVVIEIKRSNQSAREALHELLKYHESLKAKLGLRDSEIECLVVSTEWQELMLSFSAFASRARFSLRGYKIAFDGKQITNCNPVRPIQLQPDRLFSPIQGLRLYETRRRRKRGIQSHSASFESKGLLDYILVLMRPSFAHVAQMKETQAAWGSRAIMKKYMIYSAIRRLPERAYREIMATDLELEEEAQAIEKIEHLTANELLEHLENNVLGNVRPFPEADEVEIGYPAKFKHKLLEDEEWVVERILRFGAFKRSDISDSQLLNEIGGMDGSTRGRLEKRTRLSSAVETSELLEAIARVLDGDNPIWLNEMKFVIEQLRLSPNIGTDEIRTSLFCPSNILFSIYREATSKDGFHAPMYQLVRTLGADQEGVVWGALTYDFGKPDFSGILKKYFNGDVFMLVLPLTWGGYSSNDRSVLAELGLRYATFRALVTGGQIGAVQKLVDFEFANSSLEESRGLNEFIGRNSDFVSRLVDAIDGAVFSGI